MILPFPLNYTIPSRRRAEARSRTAYLGLSSLDIDTINGSPIDVRTPSQRVEQEKQTAIQTSLTQERGRQSILPFNRKAKSALHDPKYGALIRLAAYIDTLCEPLTELLGDKSYLLTYAEPTSLDFLVLGYLSLLIFPKTPLSFFRDTIKSRYPRLSAYVHRLKDHLLGGETDARAVISLSEFQRAEDVERARDWKLLRLPWYPSKTTASSNTMQAIRELFISLPGVSWVFSQQTIHRSKKLKPQLATPMLPLTTASSALLTALIASLYHLATAPQKDNLVFERDQDQHGSHPFGQAGVTLAVLGEQKLISLSQQAQGKAQSVPYGTGEGLPLVEVDIESTQG
jgi:hypothetical protein